MDLGIPGLSFQNININYLQPKKPVHTISTHYTDQSFNPKQSMIKQKIINNHIDVDFYLKTEPVINKYPSKHHRTNTQKLLSNELQKGQRNSHKYLSNSVYTRQKDMNSTKSTQRSAFHKNISKNRHQNKSQSKSVKSMADSKTIWKKTDKLDNQVCNQYQIPLNGNVKQHTQHIKPKKKKKQMKRQEKFQYGVIIENSNEQSNIKPQNFENVQFQIYLKNLQQQKNPKPQQVMIDMFQSLKQQNYLQLQKNNTLILKLLNKKNCEPQNKNIENQSLLFLLKSYNKLVAHMINKQSQRSDNKYSHRKLIDKMKQLQTKNYNYCQIYNRMKQQGINADYYASKTLP